MWSETINQRWVSYSPSRSFNSCWISSSVRKTTLFVLSVFIYFGIPHTSVESSLLLRVRVNKNNSTIEASVQLTVTEICHLYKSWISPGISVDNFEISSCGWRLCCRDRVATLRLGGGEGGAPLVTQYWGGTRHFFLLTLYNFNYSAVPVLAGILVESSFWHLSTKANCNCIQRNLTKILLILRMKLNIKRDNTPSIGSLALYTMYSSSCFWS